MPAPLALEQLTGEKQEKTQKHQQQQDVECVCAFNTSQDLVLLI